MQVHLQEGQRERLKSVNDTGLCMIQANSGQKSLGGRTHLGAFEWNKTYKPNLKVCSSIEILWIYQGGSLLIVPKAKLMLGITSIEACLFKHPFY